MCLYALACVCVRVQVLLPQWRAPELCRLLSCLVSLRLRPPADFLNALLAGEEKRGGGWREEEEEEMLSVPLSLDFFLLF